MPVSFAHGVTSYTAATEFLEKLYPGAVITDGLRGTIFEMDSVQNGFGLLIVKNLHLLSPQADRTLCDFIPWTDGAIQELAASSQNGDKVVAQIARVNGKKTTIYESFSWVTNPCECRVRFGGDGKIPFKTDRATWQNMVSFLGVSD